MQEFVSVQIFLLPLFSMIFPYFQDAYDDKSWMNNEDLMYDMDTSSVGTSLNTTRAHSPIMVDEPLIQPKIEPKMIQTPPHSQPMVTTTGRSGRAKKAPKRFDD